MKEKIMPDNQGEEDIETEPYRQVSESQKIAERAKAADLKERLSKIKDRKGLTFSEKIVISERVANFGKNLLKKHGRDEVRKCFLYHILSGSDGYEDIVDFFDFFDEDSIEKFIESLEEEQKEKDEK